MLLKNTMVPAVALTCMILSRISQAAIITSPPEAYITPAPLLPRQDSNIGTFGWYSEGESNGNTIWSAWTYDLSNPIITSTSGYWLDWCGDDWCDLFTTCGDGTVAGPSQTTTCDAASSSACYIEYQFQSYGATDALLSKVACHEESWVTRTYFVEKPNSRYTSTSTTADISTTTAETMTTTSGTPTSTSVVLPPSSSDSGGGGTSNTGIIAGSVVGGVALICVSVLVALWIRRRTSPRIYNSTPNHEIYDTYETVQAPAYTYSPHITQAAELPGPQYRDPSELSTDQIGPKRH
ncbi:hypothetical protein K491DRAFT_686257, partial [Lophiostoma macrostomum CBS 122681]